MNLHRRVSATNGIQRRRRQEDCDTFLEQEETCDESKTPEDLKLRMILHTSVDDRDLRRMYWKKPGSNLNIMLEPGTGVQYQCEDHRGVEVNRLGMIKSLHSDAQVVEVYIMYNGVLLEHVDETIITNRVPCVALKRILNKVGNRDCY
ncbi:hypothetical protein GUITHDRAFT_151883, partial [Guillardia theta CCMP2712]